MTISTEDLQGIEENRQLLDEDPSGVGSQWRDQYEWLQELFDKLTAENESLAVALRSLSETRSDATRLLPLTNERWRTIAQAMQDWKDEEISLGKFREILVLELRDLTRDGHDPRP